VNPLTGRVALVTGAGRGMGRATAAAFAAAGARVVVADIDEAAGRSAAAEVDGLFVRADVAEEEPVRAMVAACLDTYGRLDCAVNNAAVLPDYADIVDEDAELWDRVIRVNLRSVFLCLKHEARAMLAGTGGSIVNIGSTRSLRPHHRAPAYTASKHGVIGLTKVASAQLAPRGIRVNAVCPGATLTPMMETAMAERGRTEAEQAAELTLIGRLGRPHEIAAASLWLCTDAASFVTGHALYADGGYTGS
jgi:NAD(P)-dependent dehydrogenase (short-subunit alcohol dehydrogenase family)